jgi:hypothetical protein
MALLHPFDFAFAGVGDSWFGEIRTAADSQHRDALDLAQFARLAPVERMLEAMQREGVEEPNVEAAEEYLRLLYAAFHFWLGGKRTTALDRETVERRLPGLAASESEPVSSFSIATYFHLPEHRFWGQLAEGEPHEPIDGFFLVRGGTRRTEWLVLAVLGLRADREGFSQISVTATTDDLLSATPVSNSLLPPAMPGGDIAGFHSVRSVADMVLLARLALISAGQ